MTITTCKPSCSIRCPCQFHVLSQVNETENKLAMEMSKVENRSLSEFEIFHEKLATLLHPHHYLMIMLKRHLVHLYSGVLAQLDDEDLERVTLYLSLKTHLNISSLPQVKKYAEDVASVYDVIDPGYQKERGTILGSLCEVTASVGKKKEKLNFILFRPRCRRCWRKGI